MVALIHLNEPPYAYETPTVDFNNRRFKTDARSLVPFPPDIDPSLVFLVCSCMATEFDIRPSLDSLLQNALRAVREKTPAFFRNSREEQDNAIRELWQDIVYNAPVEESEEEKDDGDDYESEEDDIF